MNKIDDFLFNIRVPRGDVEAGSLLVSEPFCGKAISIIV